MTAASMAATSRLISASPNLGFVSRPMIAGGPWDRPDDGATLVNRSSEPWRTRYAVRRASLISRRNFFQSDARTEYTRSLTICTTPKRSSNATAQVSAPIAIA